MKQQSFFDDEIKRDDEVKRMHRRNDPVESVDAAEEIQSKLSALRAVFVKVVGILQPCTAKEVQAYVEREGLHPEPESVRKRAKECLDRGLVTKHSNPGGRAALYRVK